MVRRPCSIGLVGKLTLVGHSSQRIEVDVDYSDHVTLAVDTRIVVNFPKPRFAILPVSLGLTLNTFHATVGSHES